MLTSEIESSELACSLSDEEMRARRTIARTVLLARVTDCRLRGRELELDFEDTQEVRADVERFLNLERQCCGFLSFSISPPGKALTVRIVGPEGSQSVLKLLAEGMSGPWNKGAT